MVVLVLCGCGFGSGDGFFRRLNNEFLLVWLIMLVGLVESVARC